MQPPFFAKKRQNFFAAAGGIVQTQQGGLSAMTKQTFFQWGLFLLALYALYVYQREFARRPGAA